MQTPKVLAINQQPPNLWWFASKHLANTKGVCNKSTTIVLQVVLIRGAFSESDGVHYTPSPYDERSMYHLQNNLVHISVGFSC